MTKLVRIDEARSRVSGLSVNTTLYATKQVETDRASIKSLRVLDKLSNGVRDLATAGFLSAQASVDRAVLTPDFHRGATLPVGIALAMNGAVVPGAIGNDIGCGMAFAVLDGIVAQELLAIWPKLPSLLRHSFFQGGRRIEASPDSRRALLSQGIAALDAKMLSDVWGDAPANIGQQLESAVHDPFGPIAPGSPFDEWIAPGGRDGISRDQLLGTIGGGNHFVEVQEITKINDGGAAWAWGLRCGSVGVMVHSGSVSLGRAVVNVHDARLRARLPNQLRRPEFGLMPYPTTGSNGDLGRSYLQDMTAAARFAALNRIFLSLMVRQKLSEALGRNVGWRLIHDLPHNLIWHEKNDTLLHRKGACPALQGQGYMEESRFACGTPVIVPGSMGSSSALLKGIGNPECLSSAPHGAGRVLSRNAARAHLAPTISRVVTPQDVRTARSDIRHEAERRLAEEAPRAYKPIEPVVDTMVLGGMATDVARLKPLFTIKG
ncbi:MAG: RtcB family protein [Paracoccaceae bacterium]